jgi:hypothetical protein
VKFGLLLLCACTALCAQSEHAPTVRDLLLKAHVPVDNLDKQDTDQVVSSDGGSSDGPVYLLAFPTVTPENDLRTPFHVFRYDRTKGAIQHRAITKELQDDVCVSSVNSVEQDGAFLLVSTHVSPSASCLLVLDDALALRTKLYGWKRAEVRPGDLVLEESQIHFAEVHPARLQHSDLATGEVHEIYPAKGDVLRAEFSRKLSDHMPPQEWCREHNRSCDSHHFDEHIGEINSDGAGHLVFTVTRDFYGKEDNHGPGPQHVLYVYQFANKKWTYCEIALAEVKVKDVEFAIKNKFETVQQSCTPNLPVEPDMTTAIFNPFRNQQ